ncbi:MAG: carbohydrate porin [Candidatus Methylomirabilia bacterium]
MAVLVMGLMTSHGLDPELVAAQSARQIEEQHDDLRAKVERLIEQLGNLHLGLGFTGVLQGTANNADNNPKEGNSTDATWSVDLEVGAPIGERGEAFLLVEAGQGAGLTDELGVGASFFGVNDDAGDSEARLAVTEAWYEHHLWGERAVLTAGKVDLTNYFDANQVANDETTQFLSSGLVNSIAVEFPGDNSFGARLTLNPIRWLDLSVGWGEADADFENVFEDAFVILEVGIQPTIANREGNYRIYGWMNVADHAEFADPTNLDEDNKGVGLSLDQQVLDLVTVFFRLAIQDEDVSSVRTVWSTGLESRGTWWWRKKDIVAVAVGQARLSPKFKGTAQAPGEPDDELFIEAYYRFVVSENLALSAHLQVIDNPGGDAALDTVTVLGGRVQVNF